ncbi:MAG: hypothetical protein QOH90_979 [Actinomycetota bacterium]|nr:hypothetical protein [Actinomycetota bacterium]
MRLQPPTHSPTDTRDRPIVHRMLVRRTRTSDSMLSRVTSSIRSTILRRRVCLAHPCSGLPRPGKARRVLGARTPPRDRCRAWLRSATGSCARIPDIEPAAARSRPASPATPSGSAPVSSIRRHRRTNRRPCCASFRDARSPYGVIYASGWSSRRTLVRRPRAMLSARHRTSRPRARRRHAA